MPKWKAAEGMEGRGHGRDKPRDGGRRALFVWAVTMNWGQLISSSLPAILRKSKEKKKTQTSKEAVQHTLLFVHAGLPWNCFSAREAPQRETPNAPRDTKRRLEQQEWSEKSNRSKRVDLVIPGRGRKQLLTEIPSDIDEEGW